MRRFDVCGDALLCNADAVYDPNRASPLSSSSEVSINVCAKYMRTSILDDHLGLYHTVGTSPDSKRWKTEDEKVTNLLGL
jgi:hypothetical protein